MQCPVCRESQLVMSERSGIEIDSCPQCRGVWLDRDELDKIIQRSQIAAPAETPLQTPSQPLYGFTGETPRAPRRDNDHRDGDDRRRKKKRGGFLEKLFDCA